MPGHCAPHSGGEGGERSRGFSSGMHCLRTTVARLRPLTAAQTAQGLSQARLLVIEGGLRTFQPVRHLNTSGSAEPFLNGNSTNYVEEMYYAWLENPKNVHKVLYDYKQIHTQYHIQIQYLATNLLH